MNSRNALHSMSVGIFHRRWKLNVVGETLDFKSFFPTRENWIEFQALSRCFSCLDFNEKRIDFVVPWLADYILVLFQTSDLAPNMFSFSSYRGEGEIVLEEETPTPYWLLFYYNGPELRINIKREKNFVVRNWKPWRRFLKNQDWLLEYTLMFGLKVLVLIHFRSGIITVIVCNFTLNLG